MGFFLADPGHGRCACTAKPLIGADAVLLVLGARDTQLRHGLRQLDLLLGILAIPPERLRVIATLGRHPAARVSAITQTITAHLAERGVTVDAWLPWDARGLAQRAERHGRPLATARQRSRYARAVTRLLDELFLPTAPKPKRRKHRLSAPQATAGHGEREEVVWRG